MLLNSLGEEWGEVAERRLRYLTARAQLVQRRRRRNGDIRPAWRDPMIAASLWLEAAEIAGALNRVEAARNCIERGARHLLTLNLPAGAALDVLLLSRRKSLRETSRFLIQRWHQRAEVEQAGNGEDDETLYEFALVQPQQVAYMALATTQLTGERPGMLMERVSLLRSAPFGRQKMPFNDLLGILSVGQRGVAHEAGEAQMMAVASIARLLVDLYRAIRLARSNEYLWQRGLSPVSVFDLDLAMLIVFLERRLGRKKLLFELISGMKQDERRYATDFVSTALRIA